MTTKYDRQASAMARATIKGVRHILKSGDHDIADLSAVDVMDMCAEWAADRFDRARHHEETTGMLSPYHDLTSWEVLEAATDAADVLMSYRRRSMGTRANDADAYDAIKDDSLVLGYDPHTNQGLRPNNQ